MDRRASLSNVCDRCMDFVKSSGGDLGCSCSEAQLDQFLTETHEDQKLVRKMLFLGRCSEEAIQPMDERKKATKELQTLSGSHEPLAIRNGVRSPFLSLGSR